MVEQRRGLRGRTPHTLEEVAGMHGITRERVRQLIGRTFFVQEWLELPSAHAAFDVLAGLGGPVPLESWPAALPAALRTQDPADLRIISLIGAFDRDLQVSSHLVNGVEWVIPGRWKANRFGTMISAVERQLDRLARRFAIAPALEHVLPDDRELARRILAASPRWTTLTSGWSVRTPGADPRQCSLVRTMLTELGPLPVEQIRRGLLRKRLITGGSRQALIVPDRETLRDLLIAIGFRVDAGETVHLGDLPPRPIRGGAVRLVLDMLREHGAVVDRADMIQRGEAAGYGKVMIANILGGSSLIAQRRRAGYAIRTADLEIPEVGRQRLDLRPRRMRLIGEHVDADGTVEVRYDLAEPERGELWARGRRLTKSGTWWLRLGRNASVPIEVGSKRITGIDDAVARARRLRADALVLRFEPGDSAAREVTAFAVRGGDLTPL